MVAIQEDVKIGKKVTLKVCVKTYKLKKKWKIMSQFEGTIVSKRCMEIEIVMELNFDQLVDANKLGVGNIKGNKDLREYLELYL